MYSNWDATIIAKLGVGAPCFERCLELSIEAKAAALARLRQLPEMP